MLSHTALTLAAILSLEVVFNSQIEQQLQSFDAVKIEIKPGDLGTYEKPKPFTVGDLFSFHLVMTNTSNKVVDIKAAQVLLQERPELLRDGRLLPLREGLSDRLQTVEIHDEARGPGLWPKHSKGIASVVLNDWYEPLLAGQYQLIVRHRFNSTQEWRESSISFDILPNDLRLTKTPFTSDYFSNLADELVRSLSTRKPAWRHERVKPITGSENIILDSWVSGRERVLIYAIELRSPEEATRRLQAFYGEASERLSGLGEEGLVRSGNIVSFRKGRLQIDVKSAVNSPKAEFGKQLKINKEFARYISNALPSAGLYSEVIQPRPPYATASQVKIALSPDGQGEVSTFRAGDSKIVFGLLKENIASKPVKVIVYFNHMQSRPELFWEGQLVSYLEDVQKLLMTDTEPPDYRRLALVLLEPNKPDKSETINLAEWYGPLRPGKYLLKNKYRLNLGQQWIDCGSIIFEVIP